MKESLLRAILPCISLFFVTQSYAQLSVTTTQTPIYCFGQTSNATALPSGGTPAYTYLWNPSGQTTKTATGLSAGSYTVTVNDAVNNIATSTVSISQPPMITAIFSTPAHCAGTGGIASIIPSGGTPPYSYYWSNGGIHAAVTGLSDGTYTCMVTDQHACTFAGTVNILSDPLPVANFTSTDVCFNTPTQFTNTSTLPSGSITSWIWNFGDPASGVSNTSTLQNPVHIFTAAQTFSVILTVISDKGCQDTVMIPVTVHPLPTVNFTLTKDQMDPLLWYLQPTISGTAPFIYLWDFGDGNTSTQPAPSHAYSVAGHYPICLTITDATGCIRSACDSTYKSASPGIIKSLIVLANLTGIEEKSVSVNSIFPTPSNDILFVSLTRSIEGEIRISDITGREVYQDKISGNSVQINVSDFPVGYYNLTIVSASRIIHHKILIAR